MSITILVPLFTSFKGRFFSICWVGRLGTVVFQCLDVELVILFNMLQSLAHWTSYHPMPNELAAISYNWIAAVSCSLELVPYFCHCTCFRILLLGIVTIFLPLDLLPYLAPWNCCHTFAIRLAAVSCSLELLPYFAIGLTAVSCFFALFHSIWLLSFHVLPIVFFCLGFILPVCKCFVSRLKHYTVCLFM